jgi:tRNA threonylcarbamoyladenosine biosynthesis protein TsaB
VKILALDTATENCSAALWMDGGLLQREVEVPRGHADLILSMINELLSEAGLRLTGLDAIAFGRGPGSFTGVRLGASVTQGLAFGADLPVVPVSDLLAVAQRGLSRLSSPDAAARHILVCNDARMHEVYWGCFQQSAGLMAPLGPERVGKPSEVTLPDTWCGTSVDGVGRGFAAYRQELETNLAQALSRIDCTLLPGAAEIAFLAVREVLDGRTVAPEEAVPVYLRDDVAKQPATAKVF